MSKTSKPLFDVTLHYRSETFHVEGISREEAQQQALNAMLRDDVDSVYVEVSEIGAHTCQCPLSVKEGRECQTCIRREQEEVQLHGN